MSEANPEKRMMKIVAAVSRKVGDTDTATARSFWTRIGTAFPNRDGSINLRFDYLPTSAETTIQLREFDLKPDAAE